MKAGSSVVGAVILSAIKTPEDARNPEHRIWRFLMRSPGGRPTTSVSTPCTRRSPASAPPPAGRAHRSGRLARTWPRALTTPLADRARRKRGMNAPGLVRHLRDPQVEHGAG